jgi:hypothetical protein
MSFVSVESEVERWVMLERMRRRFSMDGVGRGDR